MASRCRNAAGGWQRCLLNTQNYKASTYCSEIATPTVAHGDALFAPISINLSGEHYGTTNLLTRYEVAVEATFALQLSIL